MACSSGCRFQNCESYGACLRNKGIQVDRFSLSQDGQPAEKAKNHTLNRYKQAREAGFQPDGCLKTDMDKFDRQHAAGVAVKNSAGV